MSHLEGCATAAFLGLLATIAAVGTDASSRSDSRAARPADGMNHQAPIAFCYAEGTPRHVIEQFETGFHNLGDQRFFTTSRWPGAAGEPVELTYSFPPDGLLIPPSGLFPGEVTEPEPNVLHERLNTSFADEGGEVFWKDLFRQSFDLWAYFTGNTYVEVPDDGAPWGQPGQPGLRGDIRIVMKTIEGSGGLLGYNFYPAFGGDMVLSRHGHWGVSSGSERLLRNLIMHEHGHGLGLQHSCPGMGQPGGDTRLMQPTIPTSFEGPQEDDIRGAQSLYGDPYSPINAPEIALDLNSLGMIDFFPLIVSPLSLRNSGEVDYFSVDVPAGYRLSARVEPVGSTYLNGPQFSDGSCSAGAPLDAFRQQDFRLQILTHSGGVLRTADEGGFGEFETINQLNLGPAGTYFVRVDSAASAGDVQRYELIVTRDPLGQLGDLTGDGCAGSDDLSVLLGYWGPCPGPPSACIADLNGDGVVDTADLGIMIGEFDQPCD